MLQLTSAYPSFSGQSPLTPSPSRQGPRDGVPALGDGVDVRSPAFSGVEAAGAPSCHKGKRVAVLPPPCTPRLLDCVTAGGEDPAAVAPCPRGARAAPVKLLRPVGAASTSGPSYRSSEANEDSSDSDIEVFGPVPAPLQAPLAGETLADMYRNMLTSDQRG